MPYDQSIFNAAW